MSRLALITAATPVVVTRPRAVSLLGHPVRGPLDTLPRPVRVVRRLQLADQLGLTTPSGPRVLEVLETRGRDLRPPRLQVVLREPRPHLRGQTDVQRTALSVAEHVDDAFLLKQVPRD